MFSISRILHPYKDSKGRQKIQIRIIYNRARIYLKTSFRIIAGSENNKIDSIVRKQIERAQDRILDAMREGELTTEKLKNLFKHEIKKYVQEYFDIMIPTLKGKLSEATLKQYKVIAGKIDPEATFDQVNIKWLQSFENSLQGLDVNTINTNMKRLKAMLSRAVKDGQLKDNFSAYSPPAYKQKLVEYLTEKEILDFTKVVRIQQTRGKQIAGWYFLLSCYTGWRMGDVKRFNKEMISGNNLRLRAKKNGAIVNMPIFPRLKEVLDNVKKLPFDISEQTIRNHVKDLAGDAGIKRNVKFHAARHAFAMLLMANGFTIDEVAEKLGDSILITKVYARVHNESLDKKIRERLG